MNLYIRKLLNDVKKWVLSADITKNLSVAPNVCEVLRREQDIKESLLKGIEYEADWKKKLFAIQLTGIIGCKERAHVEAILGRVKDEVEKGIIRTTAIKVLHHLEQISNNGVIEVLQGIVDSNQVIKEYRAANEIAYLKNSAARELIGINKVNQELIDVLVNNLRNPVSKVRIVAIKLLEESVKTNNIKADIVVQKLINTISGTQDILSQKVSQKVAIVRALCIIGQICQDIINDVIRAIQNVNEEGEVIYEAVLSLIALNQHIPDKMLVSLYTNLGSTNNHLRENAIKSFIALGKKDHEKIIKYLYEKVNVYTLPSCSYADNKIIAKSSAIRALGGIGHNDEKIIAILKNAHKQDKYLDIKSSAALALVWLKDITEDVVNTLIATVGRAEGDPYIKSVAARSLGNLKEQYPQVISTLIQGLSNKNGYIGTACAQSLIGVEDDKVIEALILALKATESYVRCFAAQALQSLAAHKVAIIGALEAALQDVEPHVQSSAMYALAHSKTSNSKMIMALVNKMSAENFYIRLSAIESLVILIKNNPNIIESLLLFPNPDIIQRILHKLCILNEKDSLAVRYDEVIIVSQDIRNKLLEQFSIINTEVSEYYLKGYPLGYSSILGIPEYTKLHIAAKNGNSYAVQIILAEGKINIDDQNNKNLDTPLHLAVQNKKDDVVALLIEKKAYVNLYNKDNESALFHCDSKTMSESLIVRGERVSKAMLNDILKFCIDKRDEEVSARFQRLIGVNIVSKAVSGVEVETSDDKEKKIEFWRLYEWHIYSLKNVEMEWIDELPRTKYTPGEFLRNLLGMRAYFYFKYLLQEKVINEIDKQKIEEEILLLMDIIFNEKLIQSNKPHLIKYIENKLSTLSDTTTEYTIPASYSLDNGVAHQFYISFFKTDMIRIDNRYIPEEWKTYYGDFKKGQHNHLLIPPLVEIETKNLNEYLKQLFTYSSNLLSKDELGKYGEFLFKNLKSIDINTIYISEQDDAENCILSGHSIGVRIRLGKELYDSLCRYERYLLTQYGLSGAHIAEKNQNGSPNEYGYSNFGELCLTFGMPSDSLSLNIKSLLSTPGSNVWNIEELVFKLNYNRQYLIIDSEKGELKDAHELAALLARHNVIVIYTGIQHHDKCNTKSCADNTLLTLAMLQTDFKSFALRISNKKYNHLVTVVEYAKDQIVALDSVLEKIKYGDYYIPDLGQQKWESYKNLFMNQCTKEVISEFTPSITGAFLGTVHHSILAQSKALVTISTYNSRHCYLGVFNNLEFLQYFQNLIGSTIKLINSESMSVKAFITEVLMQNSCIHRGLINYVYQDELLAINTVISKPYIQQSSIIQSVLLKHPLKWNKDDFNEIKLIVHPDKGGNSEDFLTVNAFQKQVGDKDQMYQNLLPKLLPTIQSMIYRANVGFKAIDIIIDTARVIYEPTVQNAKKLVLDTTYLYSVRWGINSYSAIIGGAEILYQTYIGEYAQAFKTVATTIAYMSLPKLLTYTAVPHLGLAYGIGMAAYNGYSAVTNSYLFYLEKSSNVESVLRSTIAYKNLMQVLSESPLQQLYDFATIAKGYEIEVNNIALESEKASLKTKLDERGEFGQKLYRYIYEPTLEEKYALLNKVLLGSITEEEAEVLKAKHISITLGAQSYEHCMEIRDIGNDKSRSNDESNIAEYYYCYNDEKEILDYIIVGSINIQIIEHLV